MTIKLLRSREALKRSGPFLLFALTFIVGALFFTGTAKAYAEDSMTPGPAPTAQADDRTLAVKEVWLTGDTLHISVKDSGAGIDRTLELNLRDYANEGDEYVTVQAADGDGNKSNSIKFKNPYYMASIATASEPDGEPAQSAIEVGAASAAEPAGGSRPFTPDGQGEVVDNAMEQDGKEFFSITTEDGNVFYLIVDRQRENENVYLLNAVTEDDLNSLAKPGDGKNVSAIETPAVSTEPAPSEAPEPMPEPAPEKSGGGASIYILIVLAVIAAGGVGCYVKIVKPKKDAADADSYDEPEDCGEDDETDYMSDEEDETE
jgi:hypothetical protein